MPSPPPLPSRINRLVELDALRGIAAIVVMLFHYTTRYEQLYGHETAPALTVPWGHYGVNLFFMISGFVIFMTLHRINRPLDFVVSRFSRLFPAFWAAVVLTFLLTHALGLPDKTVNIGTAGMNLFMIHGLFKVPHVDSVYWTLEIELIFYGMALLLYLIGRLDKVHTALLALLALRLIYFLAKQFAGIEMSWTLSHLLILPYIAWFVCGIMIYRLTQFPDDAPKKDLLLLIAAIFLLGVVDGVEIGLLAASLTAVLWAAVKGKLSILSNPILAWLGAISYTFYLLHENIGWGVIMHGQKSGIGTNLSILLAIILLLAMATALTRLVERPAMTWIRQIYRERQTTMAVGKLIAMAGIVAILFAGLVYGWHRAYPARMTQKDIVGSVFHPSIDDTIPCQFSSEPRPLMILALGQSNAGNHGTLAPTTNESHLTTFFFDGKCYQTAGPAPGATGQAGNLWTALAPKLSRVTGRPVVFSVLAIDATAVHHWAEPGRLQDRLIETLQIQRQHGFVPDVVLWQQGEADAKIGTTSKRYRKHFSHLVALLRSYGVSAPVIAALSTRCRNEGSEQIRSALNELANQDQTVWLGPDTDTLSALFRHDGCHFSTSGIDAATELWMPIIVAHHH